MQIFSGVYHMGTSWEYSCSLPDADANISGLYLKRIFPALFPTLMQIFLASTWCDELLISAELVGASVHEAHNAIEDDHKFL
jgi:hypothetical protein